MTVDVFVNNEQVNVTPVEEMVNNEVIQTTFTIKGVDGFSPVVSISAISGGHRITITDAEGTKSIDVMDGKNGSNGQKGNGIKSAVLNSNYTLTLTFDDGTTYTTPSIRGATGGSGKDGKDGKTAYQYAVDGGYTGTEAEFAKKLAEENAKVLYVNVRVSDDGIVTTNLPHADILAAYDKGYTLIGNLDVDNWVLLTAPIMRDGNDLYLTGLGLDLLYHAVTIGEGSNNYESFPISSENPDPSEPTETVIPDWLADENEPGYIKNKPEGVGYSRVTLGATLADNITVTQGSNSTVVSKWLNYTLLNGAKNVRVIFDGVTYDCPVEYAHDDSDGNSFLIRSDEYPFSFWGYENNNTTVLGCEQGTHTISFYLLEKEYKKIDPKFLPEGIGYTEKKLLFPETTLTADEEYGYLMPGLTLTAGNTYAITYNGTLYTCKAGTIMGMVCVGNLEATQGTGDTGEPFVITYAPGLGCVFDWLTEDETHTVKVEGEVVTKIDPKFYDYGVYWVDVIDIDGTILCELTPNELITAVNAGKQVVARCTYWFEEGEFTGNVTEFLNLAQVRYNEEMTLVTVAFFASQPSFTAIGFKGAIRLAAGDDPDEPYNVHFLND